MKFSGEITVNARRDAVFASLADVHVFASLIDGVRELTPLDDTHFNAVLETKVAYMSFRFKVAVTFTEITAPHTIAAKIEGAPLGIAGRLTAATRTELDEAGNETRIRYEIDAALAGKLGSMGQPVLKAKAQEMERQFACNLQARFADSKAGDAQRSAA
jgi:carbon monoxide dehydrogenase subunit G